MAQPYDDDLLIRYLLGELSPEEQEGVQEWYLADAAAFEQLLAVEDDLIDAYVRGSLSPERRERFGSWYLYSPERRQRVVFAMALARPSREEPVPASLRKTPWWRSLGSLVWAPGLRTNFALAACLIALVSGTVWLVLETRRLSGQLETARAEQSALDEARRSVEARAAEQSARAAELAEALERERAAREAAERNQASQSQQTPPRPPLPEIFSSTLLPGAIRASGGPTRLEVPRGAERIRLTLKLEAGSAAGRFRASVESAEGASVWTRGGLRPTGRGGARSVTVEIPARTLPAGDYTLLLEGLDESGAASEIADYAFSVAAASAPRKP